jgi:hypothetical protein
LAVLLMLVCLPVTALTAIDNQLESAAGAGSVAFVLVTEPGAAEVEQTKQVIQQAMAQIAGSVMIEVDRADAANSAFVKKHQLVSAPVPLIVVFASNGVMAGGNVASKLPLPELLAMVPSPKKADALKAIKSGQAVYITASRSDMTSTTDVAKGCAEACLQMDGKCVAIDISMDDPAEADFLKQLKVNPEATLPVTVVLNAQGQMTGTFNGPVGVDNLVQAAKKKISAGCCPPGSGKTCPPTPKKDGGK